MSHYPLTYKVGRLCPVIAGGVCVGSLYWTCVTYGAVTVMQVREFFIHNAMQCDSVQT